MILIWISTNILIHEYNYDNTILIYIISITMRALEPTRGVTRCKDDIVIVIIDIIDIGVIRDTYITIINTIITIIIINVIGFVRGPVLGPPRLQT